MASAGASGRSLAAGVCGGAAGARTACCARGDERVLRALALHTVTLPSRRATAVWLHARPIPLASRLERDPSALPPHAPPRASPHPIPLAPSRAAAQPQAEAYVVQRYLENPYLVGGKKFDLRIYALVTNYAPLTVTAATPARARVNVHRRAGGFARGRACACAAVCRAASARRAKRAERGARCWLAARF